MHSPPHEHHCPRCEKVEQCNAGCDAERCDDGVWRGAADHCYQCDAQVRAARERERRAQDERERTEGRAMWVIESGVVAGELIAACPDFATACAIARRLGIATERVYCRTAGEAVAAMTNTAHAPTEWARREGRT